MVTTRHRTQVTHTDAVEHALLLARKRWPNEERASTLISLLIEEGAKTIEASDDAAAAGRRREVDAVAAEFAGIYPEGYLDDLRAGWPE